METRSKKFGNGLFLVTQDQHRLLVNKTGGKPVQPADPPGKVLVVKLEDLSNIQIEDEIVEMNPKIKKTRYLKSLDSMIRVGSENPKIVSSRMYCNISRIQKRAVQPSEVRLSYRYQLKKEECLKKCHKPIHLSLTAESCQGYGVLCQAKHDCKEGEVCDCAVTFTCDMERPPNAEDVPNKYVLDGKVENLGPKGIIDIDGTEVINIGK